MKRSDREVISSTLEKQRRKITGIDSLLDQIDKSFPLRSYSRSGKSMGIISEEKNLWGR